MRNPFSEMAAALDLLNATRPPELGRWVITSLGGGLYRLDVEGGAHEGRPVIARPLRMARTLRALCVTV